MPVVARSGTQMASESLRLQKVVEAFPASPHCGNSLHKIQGSFLHRDSYEKKGTANRAVRCVRRFHAILLLSANFPRVCVPRCSR